VGRDPPQAKKGGAKPAGKKKPLGNTAAAAKQNQNSKPTMFGKLPHVDTAESSPPWTQSENNTSSNTVIENTVPASS